MNWLIGLIVVLIAVVGVLTWLNLKTPHTTGLVNGRLQPCSSKPNCVCSCQDDEVHRILPLTYSSEEPLDQIQEFFSKNYIAQVVDKSAEYLHIVITTPTLRFKDDLEFVVDRENGIIEVRSGSRLGYSDMGVNRARIEALRTFLISN